MKFLILLISLSAAAQWQSDPATLTQAAIDKMATSLMHTNYTKEYRDGVEFIRSACFHRSNNAFSFNSDKIEELLRFHYSNPYVFNNSNGNDISWSFINTIDACSNIRDNPNLHDEFAHHVIRLYQHHYALSYDGSDKIARAIMAFYFNRGIHYRDQYSKVKILSNLYKQTYPLAEDWLKNNIIWALSKFKKYWDTDSILINLNVTKDSVQYGWLAKGSKYHDSWFPESYENFRTRIESKIFIVKHKCLEMNINSYKDNILELEGYMNTIITDFNKVFKNPTRIDNGKANIYVFPSREVYRDWGSVLFNISTSNGGIYIDKDDTLYTFDRRVPEDSQFSLAQLFKHEIMHYLVESYVRPGEWYYDRNRVYWDEGIAEAVVALSEGEQHLATYPVGQEIRGKDYGYRNIYPESGRFFFDLYKNKPEEFFKEVKRFTEFEDEKIK